MTALAEPLEQAVPLRTDEHGVVRVGDTRVTLDTVISAWERGRTPEQIAQDYDTLALAAIYSVVGYYLHHRTQVDAYLGQRRRYREEVRPQNEARFPSGGIRERLLARRKAQG